MNKGAFVLLFLIWLLASVFLWWASPSFGAAAIATGGAGPAADPRFEMTTALQAMGPHSSLGDRAKIFGRFVGTWDVEYTDFAKDGKVTRHRSGELVVGWTMDGRAIQDFWTVDPSGGRKDREVYTTVRYFDPKTGTWLATFIDPENASIARFTGGAVGEDRIVLNTQDFAGEQTRWSFYDIRPDTFDYREDASSDGGKTWRLTLGAHMQRRAAAPPSQ